jgi:Raf kinase inhibitor-like YbhB/YbcL family protein
MIMRIVTAALLAAIIGCGPARTSGAVGESVVHGLAGTILAAPAKIALASPAIGADGALARRYGADGDDISPPLRWTKLDAAKTYTIVVQDPDSRGRPFVHWLIWNIPAEHGSLRAGVAKTGSPLDPGGAVQGGNDNGGVGWYGPHPPRGDPPHHYHFQIFAMDGPLASAPGSDLPTVLGSMRGHVLASGEVVATFARTKD